MLIFINILSDIGDCGILSYKLFFFMADKKEASNTEGWLY